MENHKTIATAQLTFIPCLAIKGSKRLLIEAARVDDGFLNQVIGKKLMEYAITVGKKNGCKSAQLTTNKIRTDAHRFYERLGFKPTHLGMKLEL